MRGGGRQAEQHVAPYAVGGGDLEPVDGRAQVQEVQDGAGGGAQHQSAYGSTVRKGAELGG